MKQKIKITVLLIASLVLLAASANVAAGQKKKNYDATIEGRQQNGAFVTVIDDDTIIFKNWTVKMYTWNTGTHNYSLKVNGDEKLSGTFTGFYAEKTVKISKGANYNVTLTIDDTTFSWKHVDVMRKRVDREDVSEGGGGGKVMVDAFNYLLSKIWYLALGVISALGGILAMRIYVKHRKKHEILEGF